MAVVYTPGYTKYSDIGTEIKLTTLIQEPDRIKPE